MESHTHGYMITSLVTIFKHIFTLGGEGLLPAKRTGSKLFFNFGIPVMKDGERVIQNYNLFQEGDVFTLTTAKRKFDIIIGEDREELSEKEWQVIADFIKKCLS